MAMKGASEQRTEGREEEAADEDDNDEAVVSLGSGILFEGALGQVVVVLVHDSEMVEVEGTAVARLGCPPSAPSTNPQPPEVSTRSVVECRRPRRHRGLGLGLRDEEKSRSVSSFLRP